MYKKVIGMAMVALLAVGAYSVTKANSTDDNNIALQDLLKVNVANAECEKSGSDDGACLLPGLCVPNLGSDCTFGWGR